MTHRTRRAAVAVALAAAGTGFGIGLANAQTTPTTPPTTVAPEGGSEEAPTPEGREDCPDKDGTDRGPRRGHGMRSASDGRGAGLN